ncbi:hypothetical protein D3C81_1720400 [compost metagenome]
MIPRPETAVMISSITTDFHHAPAAAVSLRRFCSHEMAAIMPSAAAQLVAPKASSFWAAEEASTCKPPTPSSPNRLMASVKPGTK